MTPKATMVANLVKGNAFFANLIAEEIDAIKFGSCSNPKSCEETTNCLYFITDYLKFRLDEDLLDEVTEALYIEMMLIIGNYNVQTPPSVDAGANKSAAIDTPTV